MEPVRRTSRAAFTFTLDEKRVNQVRLFLSNSILLMTDERLLASRVAMTGAELVEIGLRVLAGDMSLSLTIEPVERWARLEVGGEAPAGRAAELGRMIAELGGEDPRDIYIRALQRAPDASSASAELRLARIRYEGRMTLRCEYEGKSVKIVADTMAGAAS